MDSIVRNFLQQVLGEILVLDADSINSTLPLKLKDLKMREKNIQDLLDEDSFFPFDITDGRIGSLSLTPGFFGTLEVAVTGIVVNLSFSPMKAMRAAMAPSPSGSSSDSEDGNVGGHSNRTATASARRHGGGSIQGPPQRQWRQPAWQPVAPAPVPPRYCEEHGHSDKRSKVEPRFKECRGCRLKIQTNYAEFAYCPPCSERERRCMLCGSAASKPGSYIPAASVRQQRPGEGSGPPTCRGSPRDARGLAVGRDGQVLPPPPPPKHMWTEETSRAGGYREESSFSVFGDLERERDRRRTTALSGSRAQMPVSQMGVKSRHLNVAVTATAGVGRPALERQPMPQPSGWTPDPHRGHHAPPSGRQGQGSPLNTPGRHPPGVDVDEGIMSSVLRTLDFAKWVSCMAPKGDSKNGEELSVNASAPQERPSDDRTPPGSRPVVPPQMRGPPCGSSAAISGGHRQGSCAALPGGSAAIPGGPRQGQVSQPRYSLPARSGGSSGCGRS